MSNGALVQLISSGGGQPFSQSIYSTGGGTNECSSTSTGLQTTLSSTSTGLQTNSSLTSPTTYVCLNDVCLINNSAMFGSMPAFSSLEDCQKVCGVKPPTLRPQ